MDQQIRDLRKRFGDNVKIVDLDTANGGDVAQALAGIGNQSMPKLEGHHSPSLTKLDALEHITLDQLQEDHRVQGKALHITVTEVQQEYGAFISGTDENGAQVKVWSLLLRPFGVPVSSSMKLAVKEPYYGRCPSGALAVYVHHPTDCVQVHSKDEPNGVDEKSKPKPRPMCSKNYVEVRASNLGGRGMFAEKNLGCGSMVMLEKAFALSTSTDAASYGAGIDDILEGERTNGRKLALLQQLVDKMHDNKELRSEFFDLYAGSSFSRPIESFSQPFDVYRALSIIKHNAHTIFPGNTSDHHDLTNKATRPNLSTNDQIPGIWLNASMFNHSCVPNCTWAWTGDLFVARANRDIEVGEELTVAYVPGSYDYEKRKGILKASNDFECTCPLCTADQAAPRSADIQEALARAQRLPQHAKGNTLETRTKVAQAIVRAALKAYPLDTYASLPCFQLAEPFYHLAHVILDRGKNGHNWTATSPTQRSKAKDCFIAVLEITLGFKVIQDPKSAHVELVFTEHSQPKPIGVLSLMALAELAYIEGNKEKCKVLEGWAKKLYGVWYGEDASFKKQHQYFTCKDEPAEVGKVPDTKEWKALKEKELGEERKVPAWLLK